MDYYGVFHIEGGCLQAFHLFFTEQDAIEQATTWAKECGMTRKNSETYEPETGSFHDDETDIYVMQPENLVGV